MLKLSNLKIKQIAEIIEKDWQQMSYSAKPYLEAMKSIDNLDEFYGLDSADGVILYFLCNTQQWKGPVAREVKKYLKEMIKNYNKKEK